MQKFLNFVQDEFTASQSSKMINISVVGNNSPYEVPKTEAMDVVLSLQYLKKAQSIYANWNSDQKIESLLSIAWGLEHRADEFSKIEAQYTGLPVEFLKNQSALAASQIFKDQAAQLQLQDVDSTERYSPVGLIGIVSPWTCALRVISQSLAPALAAGNAVLIKVSTKNPGVVKILGELIQQSGLPPGLVTILFGEGKEVGSFIASHPSVRSFSFCGKVTTARELLSKVAEKHIPYAFDLSSKNNLILLEGWQNFDFEKIMMSALCGLGQTGWNTNRIFLLEPQVEEFKKRLQVLLDQPQEVLESKFGSICSDAEKAQLHELQKRAEKEHGKVIKGSAEIYFVFDLPNCSTLQTEELALPFYIVNVLKYSHEISKWIDNADSGFKTVIWGQLEKSLKIVNKIPSGSIEINQWMSGKSLYDLGIKGSHLGDRELSYKSSRFSNVKKLSTPF